MNFLETVEYEAGWYRRQLPFQCSGYSNMKRMYTVYFSLWCICLVRVYSHAKGNIWEQTLRLPKQRTPILEIGFCKLKCRRINEGSFSPCKLQSNSSRVSARNSQINLPPSRLATVIYSCSLDSELLVSLRQWLPCVQVNGSNFCPDHKRVWFHFETQQTYPIWSCSNLVSAILSLCWSKTRCSSLVWDLAMVEDVITHASMEGASWSVPWYPRQFFGTCLLSIALSAV